MLVELPDHIHHTVQYSFWPPFYHPAPTPYTRNLRKTTSPTGDTNHRTHGPQMSALITTACRLHTTSHAFLNSQYSHDPHTKHNQFNVKFLRSTPPTLVSPEIIITPTSPNRQAHFTTDPISFISPLSAKSALLDRIPGISDFIFVSEGLFSPAPASRLSSVTIPARHLLQTCL